MKGKKNIGLSKMHKIFVAADEEKRKTFLQKQLNNSKCKNALITEEEWEFKENWLKNSHASPTNANETYGNLISWLDQTLL